MSKITWKMEKRKVSTLVPAGYNPRKLTDKAKADLMESVSRFGQVEPLVVNSDGTVIGGHSRIKVYADLGIAETFVMAPSRKLSLKEEKELNIRLNKNTGEWDWGGLKADFDADSLMEWGFGDDELKRWFGLDSADGVDLDEARMQVLSVFPPESSILKERGAIKFASKDDYDTVKEWLSKHSAVAAKKLLEMAS